MAARPVVESDNVTSRAISSRRLVSSSRPVVRPSASVPVVSRPVSSPSVRAPPARSSSSVALVRSTAPLRSTPNPSAAVSTNATSSTSDSAANASNTSTSEKGSSSNTGIIIGVIAVVLVVLLIAGILLYRRRKQRARRERRNLLHKSDSAWNGGLYPDSPSVVSSREKDQHDGEDGSPEQFPWRPTYPYSAPPNSASQFSINSHSALIPPESPAAPAYSQAPNPYSPTGYVAPYAFPGAAQPVRLHDAPMGRPESPAYPPHPPTVYDQRKDLPPSPFQPVFVQPEVQPAPLPVVQPLNFSNQPRAAPQHKDSLVLPETEELTGEQRPTSELSERAFNSFPSPPALMRQDSSMARPLSAISQDSSMARPMSISRPVSYPAAPPDHPEQHQMAQAFPETPTTALPSQSGHSSESPLRSATFTIPNLPGHGSEFSPDSTAPNTPALSRKPSAEGFDPPVKKRSVTPSLPPLEQHRDSGSWAFLDEWTRTA